MPVSLQSAAFSTTSMLKDIQGPDTTVEHKSSIIFKIYAKKEHSNFTIWTLQNGVLTFRPFPDLLLTLPFIQAF
jgi:hypothetical protein